jgi:hypothetical protein
MAYLTYVPKFLPKTRDDNTIIFTGHFIATLQLRLTELQIKRCVL